MNLFNIMPNNFFTVLSSKHKRIYSDVIIMIYERTKTEVSFSYLRKDLVTDIVTLLQNSKDIKAEEDEEFEVLDSTPDRANEIIRRLVESKWIIEGVSTDYERTVMVTDLAIPFINAIKTILENSSISKSFVEGQVQDQYSYNTRAEYDGYAYTIHTLLCGKHDLRDSTVLLQVRDNVDAFIDSLRQLNFKVKSYAENIENLTSVDDVVESFFVEYTQEVLDKNYHRMKTLDNVSKYRSKITGQLSKNIKDQEYIQQVAEDFISAGYYNNINVAAGKAREMLFYCIDSLQNIDNIVNSIDEENYMYTNLILKKTKFMIDNNDDTESHISFILRDIVEQLKHHTYVIPNYQDLFSVYTATYVDNDSLFKPIKNRKKFKAKRVSLSTQEHNKEIALLDKIQNYKHTAKSVEKYVLELLEGKDFISIDDLPTNDVADLIHIVYIVLYGSKSSVYTLEYIEENITILNTNFKKFIIRRS